MSFKAASSTLPRDTSVKRVIYRITIQLATICIKAPNRVSTLTLIESNFPYFFPTII